MNAYFDRLWRLLANNDKEVSKPDMDAVRDKVSRTLPVIWLLGKTGAGKSSLIRRLTGLTAAEIGNGFAPCTRTADMFDFPPELPVMRFLDTRGLGETGYDPADDLRACEQRSHVLLVVARLDDPVQGEVAASLAAVRKRRPQTPVIVIHNGADLLPEQQTRFRARQQMQQLFETAAGSPLPFVETVLSSAAAAATDNGIADLVARLGDLMPEVALLLAREDKREDERRAFALIRARVLWHASAAGMCDVAPVVGAVTVPAMQAAMLRALAKHYQVSWTRARMAEFTLALGAGAAFRFGASYALRQLGKLIPVYGQTAGLAAAGTLSFAATYALGRAAAFYLHRAQHGLVVDAAALQELYRDALRGAAREPA